MISLRSLPDRVPPHVWFAISAVFHYLGPAFAVLLFSSVGVLGVAWLRIASAALVFALIRSPLKTLRASSPAARRAIVALGLCLAAMNCTFYLALDRLPLSLVAAIEFVGTIGVALFGVRTGRNVLALALAFLGVALLIDVVWVEDPLGLFWAVANGLLFVCYILLGHHISRLDGSGGIARLGAAMAIAFVAVLPIGLKEAIAALLSPLLLLAAIGVGISSSVIPYVCDQLAMARLPRSSFALFLALLPAVATLTGIIVLAQIPSLIDCLGIALVMVGVAIHRPVDTPG
ncbi:MAG: EamA family transporter [Pseudomonadota bacterium]